MEMETLPLSSHVDKVHHEMGPVRIQEFLFVHDGGVMVLTGVAQRVVHRRLAH